MTPRSILVVDDEYAIAEVLCQILTLEGYEAEMVHNGVKCLERLAEKRYDLVLLDIMMPVMDGLEALEHIKERDRNQRVIVMSAARNSMLKQVDPAIPFIPKPFDMSKLLELIRTTLGPVD
jgi:CheY-like chemotaxis protein